MNQPDKQVIDFFEELRNQPPHAEVPPTDDGPPPDEILVVMPIHFFVGLEMIDGWSFDEWLYEIIHDLTGGKGLAEGEEEGEQWVTYVQGLDLEILRDLVEKVMKEKTQNPTPVTVTIEDQQIRITPTRPTK